MMAMGMEGAVGDVSRSFPGMVMVPSRLAGRLGGRRKKGNMRRDDSICSDWIVRIPSVMRHKVHCRAKYLYIFTSTPTDASTHTDTEFVEIPQKRIR